MASKTYSEKLLDPRWQKIKSRIQNRDEYTCRACGSTTKNLQVHHLSYPAQGYQPWDVPDSALILFCEDCHREEERYQRVARETFIRVFGFLGYSNSDMEDLSNVLVKVIPKDTDLFQRELLDFVKAFAERPDHGG